MAKKEAAPAAKKTAVAVRTAKTDVGAPGNWREELAKYAQKTVKMEESTATGNRISTKGGRLSYHDTPIKNNELDCIILAARVEKTYYDGPFDANNPRSPVCFAFASGGSDEDDMAPHDKSHAKQSTKCEGCKWNEFGTADQGNGKACKDIRGLALIAFPAGSTLEAIESNEIATLSVPVMSVKGYSAYVKELALSSGLPPFAYHSRVWLEPDAKSQYRVCFQSNDKKPFPEKFMPALLKRVKEAEAILAQPYVYVEPREAPKKGAAKTTKRKY